VDVVVDGFVFEDDSFGEDIDELESFDVDDELESFDVDEELGSFDVDDPLSDPLSDPLEESGEEPGGVVAWEPRLSVLKNPEPLKVTPTGWNTFLTGSRSPVSGWVYWVSESSANACWTSMVSPDSTNL
jgi:hypothetical protein